MYNRFLMRNKCINLSYLNIKLRRTFFECINKSSTLLTICKYFTFKILLELIRTFIEFEMRIDIENHCFKS